MTEAFGFGFVVALSQFLLYLIPRSIVVVASIHIFDFRSKLGYALVALGCLAAHFALSYSFDFELFPFVAIGPLAIVVPQLLFARDSWPRRVFSSVALLAALGMAEVPARVYWDVATNNAAYTLAATWRHAGDAAVVCLIFAGIAALLCLGVTVAERKITP